MITKTPLTDNEIALRDRIENNANHIASQLKNLASRIQANAEDIAEAEYPGTIAATIAGDLMSTLGNLNIYNLIENAGFAADEHGASRKAASQQTPYFDA